MYYATYPWVFGSIGLTLSCCARLPAPPRTAHSIILKGRPKDDESEVVRGDPYHQLMTLRHLSDEAHTLSLPLHRTRGEDEKLTHRPVLNLDELH